MKTQKLFEFLRIFVLTPVFLHWFKNHRWDSCVIHWFKNHRRWGVCIIAITYLTIVPIGILSWNEKLILKKIKSLNLSKTIVFDITKRKAFDEEKWLKKELSMVHGTVNIFFRNKTFLFVKIEFSASLWWNISYDLAKLQLIRTTFIPRKKFPLYLSECAEILQCLTRILIKQMPKISAFSLDKKKMYS